MVTDITTPSQETNNSSPIERLVLLHSPDPIDLGLRLEYSSTDGRVRIVYSVEPEEQENKDDTKQQALPSNKTNNGVVEGTVHNHDMVLEVAGVNMRRPISEHMWKLTEGLMKVAPRPIEIIVMTPTKTTTASSIMEVEQDGIASSVVGASVYGTYYQLELGENAQTTDAMLHHLPGEEESDVEENEEQHSSEIVHNPFEDIDRFGSERRIIFHTQSLGVKLHRSPSEGIVHILTVAPCTPFDYANKNDANAERPKREGPDNGHIEAGDTIFEVGGVDLRGKVIGKLEWADMVHFIKHVQRPLDMIVARDKLFTLERVGIAKDVVNNLCNTEGQEVVLEEGNTDQRDDPETINENRECSMIENTCFNIAVDDICNLPCGGGKNSIVTSLPTREDSFWIKKASHPWNAKKDNDDDAISVIESVVPSNKYESSITNIKEEEKEEEQAGVSNDNNSSRKEDQDSRPIKMQFFSRTDPKGKPSPVHMSPVMSVSPMTTTAAPLTTNLTTEPEVGEKKLTVSQLCTMFSPIKNAHSKANISESPNLNQEQTDKAHLNGLFSPITVDSTLPKSTKDADDHDQQAEPEEEVAELTSIPRSPGDWSTKSPLSEKSMDGPISKVEEPVQETSNLIGVEKADIVPVEHVVKYKNEQIVYTLPAIVKAPSNDTNPESRPHMPFYARTHPRTKSSVVVSQPSQVRTSPIVGRSVVSPRVRTATPESSPPKPFDETNDSSFHSTVLHDLQDEFRSQGKVVHSPESRDDRVEEVPAGTRRGNHQPIDRDSQLRPEWSSRQHHQERHDLSPTGSTVSVEDKKVSSAKKSSVDSTFFSERFFQAMDATVESPFVGNIKFATPHQKVPSSALFSEAFLVHKPEMNSMNQNKNDPIHVRWVQTNSPLFITKKTMDVRANEEKEEDFIPTNPDVEEVAFDPIPDVKRFNNLTAFDMSALKEGLSLVDCDPAADFDSPTASFEERNETIANVNSTEEVQKQCCAMSNFCGSNDNGMFEGLVQNCTDVDVHRQTKERMNKIPSPRRKNLLERIRNKKKKQNNKKVDSGMMEYGPLTEEGDFTTKKLKGIRKAKVQLTFQNMRGQTLSSATQFALLLDDEISF